MASREGQGQEQEHLYRTEKRNEEVFYDTIPLTHGRSASNKFFPDKGFCNKIGKKRNKMHILLDEVEQ